MNVQCTILHAPDKAHHIGKPVVAIGKDAQDSYSHHGNN
jgi:hypothetical protein